jgi:hypothetical protein
MAKKTAIAQAVATQATKKPAAELSTPAKRVRKNKAIAVRWRDEHLLALVKKCPALLTETDKKQLLILLERAQKVFPKALQRTHDSLYVAVVNDPQQFEKLQGRARVALAKFDALTPVSAPVKAKVEKKAAAPVKKTVRMKAKIQRKSPHADLKKVSDEILGANPAGYGRRTVVWSDEMELRIAHDKDVIDAYPKEGGKVSKGALARAMFMAQQRQLPKAKWRPLHGITQSLYRVDKTGVSLCDRLMKMHATMKPPLTLVDRDAPPPEVKIEVADLPDVGVEVAPAAAAPKVFITHSAADTSEAMTLGLAWQTIMEHAARAATTAAISMSQQVAKDTAREVVAEFFAKMPRTPTLNYDDLIARTVAATEKAVINVVGAPTPAPALPEPQPQAVLQPVTPISIAPKRIKVAVVGLEGPSTSVVRDTLGEGYDLRFVSPDAAKSSDLKAMPAIIATKFIPHAARSRFLKNGCELIYASGGPGSVIAAIRGMGAH